MGYSGKFFLGSDGEWKVSSSNNLKVIIDINDTVQPNNYYYGVANFVRTRFLYSLTLRV